MKNIKKLVGWLLVAVRASESESVGGEVRSKSYEMIPEQLLLHHVRRTCKV